MMKLMKFLVVALVAGGMFAPVASQAGEVDGKAIMCEREFQLSFRRAELPYTDEQKSEERHLTAYVFSDGLVTSASIFWDQYPRETYRGTGNPYASTPNKINWYSYSLYRKTLRLDWTRAFPSNMNQQCELIDPGAIDAYFQP